MKQIALYGKGGIGKSTTAANLSAALAEEGLDILQIGCDPKHDSTRMLMHGTWIPTVLDLIRERGDENIERLDALKGDVIVYDVLGDVVCGGFAMPMREGYAQEIYLVTSGELMSIYAANNIAKAIARLSRRARSRCTLGGVICNAKNIEGEQDLVAEFARRINSRLIAYIPRSRDVQVAELHRQTVVEYAPESDQAAVYRELGRTVYGNQKTSIPTPLEMDELESFAFEFVQV